MLKELFGNNYFDHDEEVPLSEEQYNEEVSYKATSSFDLE